MTYSTDIVNRTPYLKQSRNFPEERLTEELNQAYTDIATSVNDRTIGLFPTNKPAIGGEAWFVTQNKKQQNLRQVYTFTTETTIPHTIDFNDITTFTKCYGSFTDDTNWYGLIYGSALITNQIVFTIDPTNINILIDAGAPAITQGIIVLEWLSNA